MSGSNSDRDLARLAEAGKTFIDLWYRQIDTITGAWPPLVFFINNRDQLRVRALAPGDIEAQSKQLLREIPLTLAREMALAAGILTSVRMHSGQIVRGRDTGGQNTILLLLLSAERSQILFRPVFQSEHGDLLYHHWQIMSSQQELLRGQAVKKIVDALTPVRGPSR